MYYGILAANFGKKTDTAKYLLFFFILPNKSHYTHTYCFYNIAETSLTVDWIVRRRRAHSMSKAVEPLNDFRVFRSQVVLLQRILLDAVEL